MKFLRRLAAAIATLLLLVVVATMHTPDRAAAGYIGPGGALAVGTGPKELHGTFYNVDGDTLDAWIDRQRVPVGLVGVRTPMGNTACGKQAANHLRKLLKGSIRLEDDATLTIDSRNRRMYRAYTTDGQPVAQLMVQAGVTRTDGRGEHQDDLSSIEDDARGSQRGCVWETGEAPEPLRGPLNTERDRKGLPGLDGPLANSPIAFGAAFTNLLLGTINLSDVVRPTIVLAQAPPPTPAVTLPSGFVQDTVINGGLNQPTNFVWLPDGRLLVAQKNGVVQLFKNGSLQATPFIDISARVNTYFDHGLIGIAVDPNFAFNNYVYLLYTYEDNPNTYSGSKTGRLGRFTASGDTASPGSEVVVLGKWVGASCNQFPAGYDCIPSDDLSHSVGNIKFASDGSMFVTSGDGASFGNVDPLALRAQDLTSLGGKMLHVTSSGQGFTTNPFYTGDVNANQSKVWDYGLRNPFRFNLRPGSGTPYIGNVGWNTWEDIYVGVPGKNFGWPCYEGNYVQSGYQAYSQCQSLINAGTRTAPLISYGHWGGGTAITFGDFISGSNFPSQYQGNFFYTDYGHTQFHNVQMDANHNLVSDTVFMPETTNVGIVNVSMGPDGYLYYLGITNGQIFRIRYVGATSPPTVNASASPTNGLLPLTVNFSSAGTSDPNGRPLTYDWDFGDGTPHSNVANPSHTYTTKGAYSAKLTVSNNVPASNSWSTTIYAGSNPPTATITAPTASLAYKVGDVISYSGSGTDYDGTPIPAANLSWQVIIRHCPLGSCHTHYLLQTTGASGTVTVPDHGDDSYLEFQLTAANSLGLKSPVVGVSVNPTKVPITLSTSPSNLQVVYDGDAGPTPRVVNSIVGSKHTLYVPSPQSQGQAVYASWSDTGAQQHDITVGSSAATYTANFNVTRKPNMSLSLDGSSGYAAAFSTPAHNILGDWTVETWFKDQSSNGYNHGDGYLVMKGDANQDSEAPYLISIAWNTLYVGQRTGWANQTLTYNIASLSPNAWHHVAATYVSSSRLTTIYLDGVQVAQGTLGGRTATGNSLPLSIGRNGSTGNNFMGKLDDVRVWNIARSASDISANLGSKYIGVPGGLISNWQFLDGSGTTAVDNAGTSNATLGGAANAATFSSDTHGAPVTATATPTPTNTAVPGTPTNTPTPQTCPCTIWPSSATPTNVSANDANAVEVGVKFQSDTAGYITGIRFFKGGGNGGTHVGNLWSSSGTNLGSATFAGETASGWQQVNFASPVAITANTTYIASYFAPQGHYSGDLNYFNSSFDRAPLHALASGSSAGNGLYLYTGTSAVPTNNYSASNYWVDVVFSQTVAPTSTPTQTPTATRTPTPGTPTATPTSTPTPVPASCPCTIWPSTTAPTNLTSTDASAIEVGVKFRSDQNGYVSGIRFYKLSTNTGTHSGNLWSSTGTNLGTATFTGESASGWQQVNFASPIAVTANTTYVASYFAPNGRYAVDQNFFTTSVDRAPLHALADAAAGGNGVYLYSGTSAFPNTTYQASNYWVDVVFSTTVAPTATPTSTPTPGTPTATPTPTNTAVPATCPCSIWTSASTPTTPANTDGTALEVGVKFRSDTAGQITGIRFYKGAGNTGTHVGNLWSSTGTNLGTVTFTGESASGWQTASFATPINITANTTYVASYFAPVGHYASDQAAFNTSVDRAPLHALASGASGGNGVYVYTGASAFPNNSYNATNYWVDVVFR